jgi:RES domain-containing protein
MRAFRIVKRRHAPEAFTGDGARMHGGRWNHPGVPMVYAAQTRALAAMETLVHFRGAERRISFVTFEIEIPERLVSRLRPSDLPKGWRSPGISIATQDLGSHWQREGRSVALAVPSVMIPEELCILLNPEHPDTDKVRVGYPSAFDFDERL